MMTGAVLGAVDGSAFTSSWCVNRSPVLDLTRSRQFATSRNEFGRSGNWLRIALRTAGRFHFLLFSSLDLVAATMTKTIDAGNIMLKYAHGLEQSSLSTQAPWSRADGLPLSISARVDTKGLLLRRRLPLVVIVVLDIPIRSGLVICTVSCRVE